MAWSSIFGPNRRSSGSRIPNPESRIAREVSMEGALIVFVLVAVLVLFVVYRTAVVVPQQSAYVVERLGRYSGTLNAGFHLLVPFVDVIRYRHSLKEQARDIPEQVCITRDNVQVAVDGVLYLKVLNAERASIGRAS